MEALLFSVSGQRLTNKTELYHRLKEELSRRFPEIPFMFPGNPFDRLPFPLTWERDRGADAPTTRLLECWTRLDRFCSRNLCSLLRTKSVIFVHGFGLDALLHATACVDCETANDEAFRLHNGLVRLRLQEQNIEAPEYFITRADVRTLDARIVKRYPALTDMPQAARTRFIRYEEGTINTYFRRIKHQKEPHFIDAGETVENMVEQVVAVVMRRLQERKLLAA